VIVSVLKKTRMFRLFMKHVRAYTKVAFTVSVEVEQQVSAKQYKGTAHSLWTLRDPKLPIAGNDGAVEQF
jgi:hypothetical protein